MSGPKYKASSRHVGNVGLIGRTEKKQLHRELKSYDRPFKTEVRANPSEYPRDWVQVAMSPYHLKQHRRAAKQRERGGSWTEYLGPMYAKYFRMSFMRNRSERAS